jgi:hypothetical protein
VRTATSASTGARPPAHDRTGHEAIPDWLDGQAAVLDVGDDIGALVLYTGPEHSEREIEISPLGADNLRVHTAIHERHVSGEVVFAGVFPELRAGRYRIWTDDPGLADRATIVGGQVTEVDWRS